ncbi:MAG: restriction endonuclease subunit S [Blastocatellia bacterium]|nr:restriction endonuclease subunit S [Blastocatellia bacterium]
MADEWRETTLDDLIEIKHGFAFKGEFFCDEPRGDILLTPGNFAIGGGFKADKVKYYDGPVPDDFVLHEGDLIVTMTDLSKNTDTLGYPAFVPSDSEGRRYLHNQRLGKVVAKDKNTLELRYLYYVLCSAKYRHEILASATGTTVKHTSPERIKRFHLRLPPLPEQRAIAHILGTLDDKIELNRRMSQTLEQMARALFKAWFVDFEPVRAKMEGRWKRGQTLPGLPAELYDLFPARLVPSELGEIPEGWEVGRLADLAAVKSGKRPSTLVSSTPTEGVSVSLWGGNGAMGYVCAPLFCNPIILTGRVGTLGSVFRISEPCWPSDNTLVVLPADENLFEYLYFCMKRFDYEALNRGSTQPLLTQTDLMNQTVLIPFKAIVAEFHKYQAVFWSRIDKMNSESRTLAALRDALLPKLIRGEIRVKDAEGFLKERGL